MNKDSFETYTKEETFNELNTKMDGLSKSEANERLLKYGKNELDEGKKKNFIKVFFSQLNEPMIYILFAAIILTTGISIYETIKTIKDGIPFDFFKTGDWPDVIIILIVIFVNAILGTVQELKAENSLEALKKMSSPMSTVLRDGKKERIKSNELVIGDIVYIEEGDTIGADLRLIETVNLKVNESSLTGESVPVEKNSEFVFTDDVSIGDRCNMAYQSTIVSYGRVSVIVVKTGMNTEIGHIVNSPKNLDNLFNTFCKGVNSSLVSCNPLAI